MSDIFVVILFSLIGGVFSLAGGFLLLGNEKRAQRLLKYVTPFAAGALLSAAFMDLLPEAAHEGSIEQALTWALIGMIIFLILERLIKWFHYHDLQQQANIDTAAPLIIISDTMHNFLDGIAIGAAFLVDIPTGIVTSLAVAAHEIPQEIGDFGLLLAKGMSRLNVIRANVFSALATTVAAVSFFLLGREIELSLAIALGLVAGFFIFIAVSDIMPIIRKTKEQKIAAIQIVMLVLGVFIVNLSTTTLHDIIEAKQHEQELHENNDDHSRDEDTH